MQVRSTTSLAVKLRIVGGHLSMRLAFQVRSASKVTTVVRASVCSLSSSLLRNSSAKLIEVGGHDDDQCVRRATWQREACSTAAPTMLHHNLKRVTGSVVSLPVSRGLPSRMVYSACKIRDRLVNVQAIGSMWANGRFSGSTRVE